MRGLELLLTGAKLIASDLPLRELLAQLAVLLGSAADAARVSFSLGDEHASFELAPQGGEAIEIPVTARGGAGGTLLIAPQSGSYDAEACEILASLALQLGTRMQSELAEAADLALRREVSVDALTGIANRRAFDETLAREWRRCARSSSPLALALLDVDYFKRYNDAYGHIAGDTCLKAVAQAIAGCAKRPGDLAARYGGEEFSLILPECDVAGAIAIGEEVASAVRGLALAHQGSSLGMVSVSVGIAIIVPASDDEPAALLEAADARLYEAKRAGRNRVAAGDYVSDAPAALPQLVVRQNLPRYLTPIVGRDREIAEVRALLEGSRLINVVGTGGLGKTRVAVHVAETLIDRTPDGVWFVDLARVSDPALIPEAIAGAIGFEISRTLETASALVAMIRPLSMLLVLDNCEHVIAAAAAFADRLLRACHGLTVLATSREPLGVEGESVYRLGTLDDSAAVALFVDRARRSDQRYALGEDGPTIVDICRRLDGIALAIELAAARVHRMSSRELLAGLDERFAPLLSGGRTALPRHQTMRASIDWSFELLSLQEQNVLCALGVFSGGFSMEAALAVASRADQTHSELQIHFFALTDKSLVTAVPGQRQRFTLLESIRRYALSRLEDAGELESTQRAHAEYFAQLSIAAAGEYGSVSEEVWLLQSELDVDNFRAAFDWAQKREPPMAATIVANLVDFWGYSGLFADGLMRAEAALAALGDLAHELEGRHIWIAVARTAWEARAIERSIEAAEHALAIATRAGDDAVRAEATYLRGRSRFLGGADPARGLADLAEAVRLYRGGGNPARVSRAFSTYGYALATGGNDIAAGRALQVQALEIARAAGLPRMALTIEISLAESEFSAGEIARAVERAKNAHDQLKGRKWPFLYVVSLGNLASYLGVAEHYDQAEAAAREAVSLARDYAMNSRIPPRIQALALAYAGSGDAARAARLLGFVDAAYLQRSRPRERTEAIVREHLLELLNEQLVPTRLGVELAAGRQLHLDAAIALALDGQTI